MKIRKLQLAIMAASLAVAMSASASMTFSGTALSGLTYHYPPDAQYVAAAGAIPALAALSTTDSGVNGDAPAVFVRAADVAPSSLGTLSGLSASYELYGSATGPSGTAPYFLTYLYAPNGGYVGVLTMGGPTLDSSSTIHVIYSGATDTGTYWGDSLSTLYGLAYEGTTFGQLTVFETGVAIGDWANGTAVIPASANIESITLFPAVAPVPEPTTMIAGALLLLPFGASTLRLLRKNRKA